MSGNRHQTARPHQQHKQQTQHALRQTEEEPGTTTQHAGGSDGAYGKDLRDFAILLDNTLAVDETKTVGRFSRTTLQRSTLVADRLGVEETSQLAVGHPLPCVFDRHFHIVGHLTCLDSDSTALRCIFTGIVSHRVEHEECQHSIGLHDGRGRFYIEGDALHLERRAPPGKELEEVLQREALDMQAELTLTQLNPVGEHIVVFIDLISQFTDIVTSGSPDLRRAGSLVADAVDKRRDGVD